MTAQKLFGSLRGSHIIPPKGEETGRNFSSDGFMCNGDCDVGDECYCDNDPEE